jgi:hypothetical protein
VDDAAVLLRELERLRRDPDPLREELEVFRAQSHRVF